MKKKTSKNILWEKTYRGENYFDNAHTLKGKETGDWSGVILIYRFLILGGVRPRFLIEPDVIEFSGKDEEEMFESFERSVGYLEEWKLGNEHYTKCDLFPDEVNQKLTEFNLQKYVKKVS